MARTNRPDEAYHIPKLNFWFAISSIALLITSVWMVWADYARPWKNTQRDFRSLERIRLGVEEQLATEAMDAKKVEATKAKIAEAEKAIMAKRGDVESQQLLIEKLEQDKFYVAKQQYNFAKAALGAVRYDVEERQADHPNDKAGIEKGVKEYECEVYRVEGGADPGHCDALPDGKALKTKFLDAEDELLGAKKKYDELVGQRKDAEKDLETQRAALGKLEKRLEKISAGFFNDNFRDAPLLDFLVPSLKIEQAVVKEIRDDYNFATVQKEDRCMTCHLGISNNEYQLDAKSGRFAREGTRRAIESPVTAKLVDFIGSQVPEKQRAEVKEAMTELAEKPALTWDKWLADNLADEKQVAAFKSFASSELEELRTRTATYKAHPDLALYTTSNSAHPMEKVGCTVCHEGRGHATEFGRVFHTPRDKKQEEEWAAKYGWKEAHYWDYPQLPVGRVTASCAKCHSSDVTVRGGASYNRGRELVERNGCFGCHRIEGLTGELRKVGPSLTKVASKLDRDFAYSWIWNPHNFRPSSKMPRFFEQSNNSTDEALARTHQEVRGIVAYLWDRTDKYNLAPVPNGKGDAEHGHKLFQEVGCLGCHSMEQFKQTVNTHGPDLSGVGSKLSAQFIYNWITNPRGYFPATHMPSLRLSQQEALDITAFLSGLKKDGWKTPPAPARDAKLQDVMLSEALSTTMRRTELRALLDGMTEDKREVLLGEKSIEKYGCTGCHEVKGKESAGPIGTELTVWADKFITQLDFALIPYHGDEKEIDYSHLAWASAKLKNPRFWDRGKEHTKSFAELLKMPNFELDDKEIYDIVTFLMSRKRQAIDSSRKPVITGEYLAVQAGRRVVRQYNCHGCHYFDGEGGNFARYWEIDSAGKASFATKAPVADFDFQTNIPGPVRGHVPPQLMDQGNKTRSEWLFSFLKEPVRLRPQLKMRMPTFKFSDEETNKLLRMFAGFEKHGIGEQSSYEPSPQLAVLGQELFERGKCVRCHAFSDVDPATAPDGVVAPNLKLAASRLQPGWIPRWLKDPQSIMPGANMPNFFDFESKFTALDVDGKLLHGDLDHGMDALRDYLMMSGKSYRGGATAQR